MKLSKEEIKTALVNTGSINRFRSDNLWGQAFQMYNSERKENLKPTCGTCFKKVKEWILKA